jgi:hypothetical protein
MIRLAAVISAMIASLLLWHECGQDIGIFCYRIGWGALATVRTRALVPVATYSRNFARTRSFCSNQSGFFSILSTTLKD